MRGWIGKYGKSVAIQILLLAALAFLMRRDPFMPYMVGGVALLAGLSGVISKSPLLQKTVLQYPILVKRAGVACIGLSVLAIFIVGTSGAVSSNALVFAGILVLMLIGCLLITLPRSTSLSLASRENPRSGPENPGKNFQDAQRALLFPLRHLHAYFRIVFPAAILFCVLPLLVLQLAAYADGAIPGFFSPVGKYGDGVRLAYYLAYAATLLYVVPATAIAWHRYVQLGAFPRFLFPSLNGRFWRYWWRIVAFGYAVNALTKLIDSGGMPKFADSQAFRLMQFGAVYLAWGLALWAFAGAALQLAAISEDNRKMDMTAAIFGANPLGRGYGLGFVFSIFPYLAAAIAFQRFAIRPLAVSISLKQIGAFGFDFLVLTAIACGATYLSDAYLRIVARGSANYPA